LWQKLFRQRFREITWAVAGVLVVLLAAAGGDFDPYLPVGAIAVLIGRRIGNQVLRAQLSAQFQ